MQETKKLRTRLSFGVVLAICREIEAGVPMRAIAERYDISETQVRWIKDKYGVRCTLRSCRPTKGQLETAYAMRRAGLSDWYIAKFLGVKAKCLFKY